MLKLVKKVLRCTNQQCLYGPAWDRGEEVKMDAFGVVAEHRRAESYDQELRASGIRHFDGLCINCIDDRVKDQANYR